MEDKLEDLEILGINGLDAAAVGTAMVGGEAVLVYDYDKCVELIIAAGNEVNYAEDYILELSTLGLSGLVIERPIILTDWRQRCWPVDLIHRPLIFLNLL